MIIHNELYSLLQNLSKALNSILNCPNISNHNLEIFLYSLEKF